MIRWYCNIKGPLSANVIDIIKKTIILFHKDLRPLYQNPPEIKDIIEKKELGMVKLPTPTTVLQI